MGQDKDKDKDLEKRISKPSSFSSEPHPTTDSASDLRPNAHEHTRRPASSALAAALDAAQRLAAESDAEEAAGDMDQDLAASIAAGVCRVCGYRNREGNRFCGKCGSAISMGEPEDSLDSQPGRFSPPVALPPYFDREPGAQQLTPRSGSPETHHYHHHYHHHYFPGGGEAAYPRSGSDPVRELEKARPTAALRGDMSRAEAAVRRITHEWAMACNTKHLDDLLDLYIADALVLRSNYPPVRGAAAIREFFFGALDAGLGEIELEPLRVEVVGDLAYEAGRCKALVPGATGKRREERGKYLWVCARQSAGDWKLAADCWSSDLTLTTTESDIPVTMVKTSQPRKP
jgi:ketosteroid isomerase-like protein